MRLNSRPRANFQTLKKVYNRITLDNQFSCLDSFTSLLPVFFMADTLEEGIKLCLLPFIDSIRIGLLLNLDN